MNRTTRMEVLEKLRRRYKTAGAEHKRKLLDQAVQLLGYHRKSAIRALGAAALMPGPVILTGRPVSYEPSLLLPWLRPIWQATDYACGRRLVAMLPEWIPAYEQYERRLPGEVREKLLLASGRTLDRLLEPLRAQGAGRSLTRPGTLLRQQIPIRGSVWEEGKAGWLPSSNPPGWPEPPLLAGGGGTGKMRRLRILREFWVCILDLTWQAPGSAVINSLSDQLYATPPSDHSSFFPQTTRRGRGRRLDTVLRASGERLRSCGQQ